jgi:hypothetical protein
MVFWNDNCKVDYRLFFRVIHHPTSELALISQVTLPTNNEMIAEYSNARSVIDRLSW